MPPAPASPPKTEREREGGKVEIKKIKNYVCQPKILNCNQHNYFNF